MNMDRYALIASQVTLDDKPAMIVGLRLDFPLVVTLDGKHRVEFSWKAVQHVVENKQGKFKS